MIDKTFRRPIDWKYGACTDVGTVRSVNEDAVLTRSEIGLWGVADGMGGHQVGDVASQMIVDALENISEQDLLTYFVDDVERCLVDVNRKIIDYSQMCFDNATMGSTIVTLLIRGRVGVCLWAGDSRLYRIRNGRFTQLSRDHSHVQELIDMGAIEEQEAQGHPQANVITRAIGVENDVFIDINVFDTQIGDTYLLCSDGLHNSLSDEEIVAALTLKSPGVSASTLIAKALQNKASDNVSVVVVKGEAGKLPGVV